MSVDYSKLQPNGGSPRGLRRMFTRVPGERHRHPVRNGLIFLAVIAFILISGYSRHILFVPQSGYTVNAVFANIQDLYGGSPVRVDGIDVGSVSHTELNPHGPGALVTMRITKGGFRLHSDARAALWWRTLLGKNFYVQLDPGSPDAPVMRQGGTIPIARTTSQVEVDQALYPLTSQARKGVQTFIQAFAQGFNQNQAVAQSIDRLAPAMQPTGPALQAMRGTDPGDLPALVDNASKVLGAVSRSEVNLGDLISSANTTLGVTAAQESALGQTFDQAPATEQNTMTTMARLRTTLSRLDPVATALEPGASEVASAATIAKPALAQLQTFLGDATPLLHQLQPALRQLAGAATVGVPLINALTPTLDRAQSSLLPWLAKVNSDTKLHNYAAIGPFFSVLDSAAEGYDANGHALNFSTAPDERSLSDLPCLTYFTDPSVAQKVDCSGLMNLLAQALGHGLPVGGKG